MVYKPNKLQKIIALLLLCCFALTAFAGCGNNNQQADSQPIRIGCKPSSGAANPARNPCPAY